jgi:NAD(P)-dependent dehydrogenase (short-subunit alcohol dehydrogenase family)
MKKVLVTGGNRGVGLEIVKLFLTNNYDVIILARNFANFPQELQSKVKQIPFDLQNISDIPHMVNELGEIDILINNAGILDAIAYDNYPEEKKRAMLTINLEAPIALITEISKGMIEKKAGRIVNISSISGQIGHPDVWYGITKAGLINATKTFSKILGPQGIIINCVAPGPIETDMYKVITEERKQAVIGSTILKRPAFPKEVAQTVYWLAAESPEYINGTCVDINNTAFLR